MTAGRVLAADGRDIAAYFKRLIAAAWQNARSIRRWRLCAATLILLAAHFSMSPVRLHAIACRSVGISSAVTSVAGDLAVIFDAILTLLSVNLKIRQIAV